MYPTILLAACNASDPLQFFSRAASRVTWGPSSLCVTWDNALDTSPLQLLPCSASLTARQAWDYAPAASSVENPPGACAGPTGQCLQWAGANTPSCSSAAPSLGVGCAVTAWPTPPGPTGWNCGFAADSPAPGMLQALHLRPGSAAGSGLCAAVTPPLPPPLPSADILAWADREVGLFISFDMISVLPAVPNAQHFCLAAGGDRGFPVPPPSAYAPSALSTDAWLAAATALGARYSVLVAQHCSGFAQWPTDIYAATGFNYSYSTRGSPLDRDVVAEYIASCARANVSAGLYYSLNENYWLNVGAGRVGYAPPAPGQLNVTQAQYDAIAAAQQIELWQRYPNQLGELWFDGGADLPGINAAIAAYQPQAALLQGSARRNNIRWVGTESGHAAYPVWSTTDAGASGEPASGSGSPTGALFAPAETDTTLSRSDKWFWKPGYDYRTLPDLQAAYHASVGANGNLLLNLAPDADGAVPAQASELYSALGDWIRRCYGAPPAASLSPPSAGAVLLLALPQGTTLDRVVVMEDQAPHGEQVLSYSLEVASLGSGGAWAPLGGGAAIGHKRIHVLAQPVSNASAVRLTVTAARTSAPVAWRLFAAIDGGASGC
jgi:alpha-L-fucosidase